MSVRVNITISDETKKFFEAESEKTGVSQSSLMCMALSQYIDSKKAINEMSNLKDLIEKLEILSKKENKKNE